MRATILGLATDDVADPEIESRLERDTYPAIDAEAFGRLDGSAVYVGDAAATIEEEEQSVYITESGITTEPHPRTYSAACEWIADLSEGWVGVDTSDGEWLFNALGGAKGVRILRAEIDVDGFAAYLRDYPSAGAWNVTQTRSLDPDDDAEETAISYHDAAHLADTAGSRETTMLGFQYRYEGQYTRGVVAASGYLAVFNGPTTPCAYAEFVNSEILPFAELPEEYQGSLASIPEGADGVEADGGVE